VKKKRIKHELEYLSLKASLWLVNLLPWWGLYLFASAVARIAWAAGIYHRVVFENLNRIFGNEKSEKEIREIAFRSYRNMAKNICEAAHYRASETQIKATFTIEGEENLQEALAKGKGVIALIGHFGNFAWLGAKLNLSGYRFAYIMYGTSLRKGARVFKKVANRFGLHVIPHLPHRPAVQKSLAWLRANRVLGLHGDRNFPSGVFVDFFGYPAATAPGPVILAKRTGATVLPMIAIRGKDDRHKIIIASPLEMVWTGEKEKDILRNVQKYTRVLEEYIRQYPEQWFWTYRRWKTKPGT
jgi:KDO2-lipid IV(A) lauroyltransferase